MWSHLLVLFASKWTLMSKNTNSARLELLIEIMIAYICRFLFARTWTFFGEVTAQSNDTISPNELTASLELLAPCGFGRWLGFGRFFLVFHRFQGSFMSWHGRSLRRTRLYSEVQLRPTFMSFCVPISTEMRHEQVMPEIVNSRMYHSCNAKTHQVPATYWGNSQDNQRYVGRSCFVFHLLNSYRLRPTLHNLYQIMTIFQFSYS